MKNIVPPTPNDIVPFASIFVDDVVHCRKQYTPLKSCIIEHKYVAYIALAVRFVECLYQAVHDDH